MRVQGRRGAIVLVLAAGGLVACGGSDSGEGRERVARTVRANLEKACNGTAECLQAIHDHFEPCLDEYIADTEQRGEADPRVMAQCMNRRAGREWFQWREK